METNMIGSCLAHDDCGFQFLGFFPGHVGRLNDLDGQGLGRGSAANQHLDALIVALVPRVKRQGVLLAGLEVESWRYQPVIGIRRRVVGVTGKPVIVAVVGEIPGGFVLVGIDDGECLLLVHSLEGVQVRIGSDGFDNSAIVVTHLSGTSGILIALALPHGGMMRLSLDGTLLFVLHDGRNSGFMSLDFHNGVPPFVGRRRRHGRHIGFCSGNVNFLGGQVLGLPQSVMGGPGHSRGQVHRLLRRILCPHL